MLLVSSSAVCILVSGVRETHGAAKRVERVDDRKGVRRLISAARRSKVVAVNSGLESMRVG
jgi:hypothetical protein